MQEIKIANKIIGKNHRVFVSVDIGKNHNGSMQEAKWLVDKALEGGADAVKFQTHIVEDEQRKIEITSPHFKDMDRYTWVKQNTMPKEWWEELANYCKEKGIIFYSTPMSTAASDLLEELDVPMYKIGSADITDLFMIENIAKKNKPIIISSGMTTLEDLRLAISTIRKHHDQIVLMHCVSEYPCPPEHLNLRVIEKLSKEFDVPVGLSDHVLELETASAAVALGIVAVEKHFSRNREQFGPDHKVSLTPEELKDMVQRIRNVEKAMGDGEKSILSGESKFTPIFYKSIVSKVTIPKGTVITREHLTSKRPGDGLMTKRVNEVIGKTAKKEITEDSLILLEDLE